MSTVEFQDRETSLGWQREVAEETIRGRGVIVAEYFDEGCSRRLPWRQLPAALQLMAAAEQPGRSFDAVVIGEYERAFYGDQFATVLTVVREQGVQLWLPEADGPVNLDDPAHQALMLLLGSQSRREVLRARHRVLAAMEASRPVFKAGSSAAGHLTATAWPTPAPTQTGLTRAGVAACTAWNPIRPPHRGCGGSSSNARPDAAWPGSRGS